MHTLRHLVLTAAASLLCTVYSPRSHANVPTLVRDINTVPIGVSSNPSFLGTLGGATFFAATDGIHGMELWRTNGTAAGTVMVQDIEPGMGSSNPANFATFGSRAYFVATTQASGTKVWVTDGTSSGTYKLTDLIIGAAFPTPSPVGALGSTVLIGGGDPSGLHLWGTDGTTAGTVLLADISFTPALHPNGLTVASNGKAYFAGFDNVNGGQPWVTDGTPAGTHLLPGQPSGLNSFSPTSFVQAGNYVYFVQSTNQVQNLFRIRLTDDGIEQVTTGIGIEDYASPAGLPLVPLGNLVLFVGNSAGVEQVWRSDGTTTGTYAVCPFNSALGNSYVAPRFTVVGAHAFFVTVTNTGASFFASDGTVTGTVDLLDAGGFPPRVIGAAGSYFYFAPSQSGIYRSDGTGAGTKLITGSTLSVLPGTWLNFAGDSTAVYFGFALTNATSGAADYVTERYDPATDAMTILNHDASQPGDLFALSSGLLYFSINSPTLGIEPGVSDGTATGTHLLADIAAEPSEAGSNPTGFVNFKGQLYFSASDGIAGQELWRSDGTAAGTQLAADVIAGPMGSNPLDLFVAGQSLMFFAYFGPGSGTSLWRYDPATGTAANDPAVGPPYPCGAYATATVQGLTYFAAYGNGFELWKTDGTPAGTASVQIPQGVLSNPCSIVGYGGKAYVIAQQFGASAGYYLWSSDGTAAGTQAVAFLGAQPFATPFFVTPYAGQLYFAGVDSAGAPTLWRSDGTAAGTHSVTALPASLGSLFGVVNNRLLFTGVSGSTPGSIWSFDVVTAAFAAISGILYYQPGPIAEGGAMAFFTGLDATHGLGPWVTDGTPAGTKALADGQGNYPSSVQWVGDFSGVAIYTAVNSSNAAGYWRSDGTVAGTHMIAPLTTGQSVSVAGPGLAVGNHFYFALTDPAIGTELYSLLSDVPATTTTTLKAVPTSAVEGKSIVLTATVTPAPGASAPTGLVTFSSDAGKLGSVALNAAGVAVLSTATLAVGTHAITVAYAGDTNDAASTSAPTTVTVTAKAPTVKIGISPASIPVNGSATLTWSSTDASGCTAGGAWTGAETTQGSLVVMPATAGTLTYTLACTGAGGSATGTTTLTVTAAPKSGGGGGGAFDLIGLAALGVIVIVRFRRFNHRAR